MPNVFTGQEFARSLSEGKLKEPLVKIGMAKKHDDSPNTILFAEGGLCDEWISIPVGVIEQVTFLQNVTCRDHRHPLVMIQFKEPDAKNEAASVFAALSRQNLHTQPMQPLPGMLGKPPETIARPVGGGGAPDGLPGLNCIAWHEECGWKVLYISSLNLNVPVYVCWKVCDTYGIPVFR
jgi:hypothetical protein